MSPSTSTSLPVMNEASCEITKETTLATSSGVPRRPSGLPAMMSAMIGFCTSSERFIGVSLMPGETDMMRAARAPQGAARRRAVR